MSTPFQNRLVGTIIVAAAAVIFLPDLLDGKNGTYQVQFEQIPQKPLYKEASKVQQFPEQKVIQLTSPKLVDEQAVDDVEQSQTTVKQSNQHIEQLQDSSFADKASDSNIETLAKAKVPVTVTLDAGKTVVESENKSEDLKKAWVIQLGSFKHKANVDNLMKKLKKQGYLAYTRPIATKNGELIKVFVGPELDKQALLAQQKDLKKLTGSAGKLVQYQPAKS